MNNTFLMLLFERLELFISAGLPLDRAVNALKQGSSKRQARAIEQIYLDIMSGVRLATAFSSHTRMSRTLIGLIEHGEASGDLPGSLALARSMLERQSDTFKKCISALVYPSIIGVFAIILTLGLVRGVMPQITPMLKSLHVQLPILTRMMISISEHIVAYGLYVGLGAVTIIVASIVAYRYIFQFRYVCQWLMMNIPVIGSIVFLYSVSLFLRSCGSLIESGLQVSESYTRTAEALPLLPFKKSLLRAGPKIQKGINLSELIRDTSRHIPAHVPSLVSAGELSGTLGVSLIRAASIIDRDMDHSLKRLTSLIEPCMMVGMGCTVGSIALSIMMPIYDMSKALQH